MELNRPSVIVALLTPFDENGDLDKTALGAHVDYLVDAGVDALMPCGTTGEGALLADVEVADTVRATCAAAGGRVPVLAHVGRPGTGADAGAGAPGGRARRGRRVRGGALLLPG